MRAWKKYASFTFFGGDRGSGIYIFSGEPHFLERGHKIFEFSNILQARCACRMFWLVRNFCLAHKSFHFFQRVLAESVLHEKYKPRYAENFEQMLDLWTMQELLLFFSGKNYVVWRCKMTCSKAYKSVHLEIIGSVGSKQFNWLIVPYVSRLSKLSAHLDQTFLFKSTLRRIMKMKL